MPQFPTWKWTQLFYLVLSYLINAWPLCGWWWSKSWLLLQEMSLQIPSSQALSLERVHANQNHATAKYPFPEGVSPPINRMVPTFCEIPSNFHDSSIFHTPLSFSCLPQTHLAHSVRFLWKERTRSSLPSWPLLKYTHFKKPPQSPWADANSSPSVVFSAVKPSMPTALCWKSQRPPLVLLCMNIPDHFLALEEASCHSIDPAGDFKPMCSPFFWLTVKARSCLSRSPRIHKTYYYCLLFGSLWLL